MSACGSAPQNDHTPIGERAAARSSSAAAPTLVAGLDSVTAVVVGMGESFGDGFDRSSGPGAQALFDERLAFYKQLVRASPEVRVLLFVDRPEHAEAARRAMGDADNLSVIAQPSWVWMRDFAPMTVALASGDRALVAYTPYQLDVSRTIASELGMPLVQNAASVSRTIEGGNVLVDAEGRCYTAVWSTDEAVDAKAAAERRDLAGICREVRTVPRMPYEPTGHIDIHTRFLDERTVLVAEYADETFGVAAEPIRRAFRCTDDQAARGAWTECEETRTRFPTRGRLRRDESGEALALSWSDVQKELGRMHPDAETASLPAPPWPLRVQLDKVADLFGAWGFRVVRVRNPAPYLAVERLEYEAPDGRVVHRVVHADPVFPTYTNALVVNGRAYLPQYATAAAAENAAARRVYAEHGFEVEPVDMTENIAFRGAARCLTLEIHGAPATS